MEAYTVQIWYRYAGGDEKDFFETEIEAETIEEVITKAKSLRNNVTRIYIKKKNQWQKIN
jgi:hypothetical protein